MRVLLDTHALLWALAQPDLLSILARSILRDASNGVLVSSASAWEIATKRRIGRLRNAEPIVAGYAAHLRMLRAEDLPITAEHALLAGSFQGAHRDPFDRMLAAQAMVEGVPLLTNDRAFESFPELKTIW